MYARSNLHGHIFRFIFSPVTNGEVFRLIEYDH